MIESTISWVAWPAMVRHAYFGKVNKQDIVALIMTMLLNKSNPKKT